MQDSLPSPTPTRTALLADPGLRRALEGFFRKRVPATDVDDLVQATLADALAAERAPTSESDLRRWVHGIARNKALDLYRSRQREIPKDFAEDDVAALSGEESARDLLRWAERELPDGEHAGRTLEWMLREGDGEKLEHIAREENVPGARVRQRISRLRQHFRARWAAQVAALLGIVLVIISALWLARRLMQPKPEIVREPERVAPEERARSLRRAALEECKNQRFRRCIDGLDRARALDPKGDETSDVREARRVAGEHLAPPPPPEPVPSAAPVVPSSSPLSIPSSTSSDSNIPTPPRKPKVHRPTWSSLSDQGSLK